MLLYLIIKKAGSLFGSYRYVMGVFSIYSLIYAWIDAATCPVMLIFPPAFMVYMDGPLKNESWIGNNIVCEFFYLLSYPPKLMEYLKGGKLALLFIPSILLVIIYYTIVKFGMAMTQQKKLYLKEPLRLNYNEDSEKYSFSDQCIGGLMKMERRFGMYRICYRLLGVLQLFTIAFCATKIYLQLKSNSSHFSSKTIEMNRQLLITLIFQTLLPFIMMYSPVGLIITLPFFEVSLGRGANLVGASLAVYPSLEPLIAMVCIKDFWKVVFYKFQNSHQDMAHVLLNSSIALRQSILYECVGKTPIFKAYKKLCARLGSNFMSYQEFEFWFMRFSRKEYDLDYDRSQDPKYTEFSDLPNNLLNRIVDEVEPIDRLILQKVCRPLRQLIAVRNPGFRKISINSSGNHFGVAYDEQSRCYSIPEVECESEYEEESSEGWLLTGFVEITWWNYHKDGPDWKQESIIEGDVFEIASNDLAIVVGNERLSLDEFEIENMYPEFNELFLQTLSARNIKVQTKKLKLHYFDLEKLEFLRYFDVEEEIILYFWTNWETLPMEELIGHPEIKNTRMLRVIMPDSTFPPDTILGFPRIIVEFMRDFLSNGETIEKLRNAILNSESLELFNITARYKRSNMNEISKLLFPNAVEDSQNPNTSYVTVPDTGRTLEMKVVEDELNFKRLE
ncbi:hypothetical protein CAEBREN_28246 [Caenorhabditis brenneri]|uniref:F-box domain-containing protein n=1 Tax=Caenorhabditis brenneri TaxID=135651 RepID=G0NN07_CAEBE|nr:hypothetical protein CAEBREN_28246 [Caenorhabditis brenneri]